MKKKVVVGMSGGVDSSVAAYILKEEGYDVIGVTMQIWQDEERESIEENGGCCGLSAVDDARRVAQLLGIPYYVMNFKDVFGKTVIDYFAKEYSSGKTPNPCIACNRFVKWEALLDKSLALGADYIATGHYAHVIALPDSGRYTLEMSLATGKDQTYALFNLTQFQLSHTLMPLWKYEKDTVRKMAADIGLCVANKPDSQEICFIPDNDYGGFIEGYYGKKMPVGNFIDTQGRILGRHKGIAHYTIGQRKGLGVAFGKPMFVKHISLAANEVMLASNEELFTSVLYAEDLNFMAMEHIQDEMQCRGKIRYAHKPADCTIKTCGGKIECRFDEPQRAVTPGQAVVFYDESNRILCGGTICN